MYLEKRADPIPLPPKPYVLSPSGSFDGNDGKWSTFIINTGDDDGTGKGQNFKVLISTSSPLTLVPQQTGWCDEDCAKNRGMLLFNGQQPLGFQKSQDWKDQGVYSIPLPDWWTNNSTPITNDTLGGVWGPESLGMGESSLQSPVLTQQYVVTYTFQTFFMGSLGLAVGDSGPPGATKPNFLNNFYKSANMTASASYGYTAGAYYRNNGRGVLGSLILGGYDRARSTDQGTSISMPSEKNTTLAVGVQSILYAPDQDVDASTLAFTKGGFEASIDSTLPYLVLPDDICDQFQKNFRLQYDDSNGLYMVNSSAHDWNTQQNASVSFKIGADARDSTQFANIVLPYAAFDQTVSFPITNKEQQYFPIRRSTNGEYVLGRTFLQEAYIVVDYERSNFSIAPAYFSEPMPDPSIVTIFNKTYTGLAPTQQTSSSGLPTGAVAGIVVGIVLAFIIAGIGAFCWWRKRRNTKKAALIEYEKPSEIDTVTAGNEVKYRRVSELTGSTANASTTGYYNNEHKWIPPISEMSPESPPVELYSPPPESPKDKNSHDYFGGGRPRRRGATRDSSGQNTPRTPVAELPGDDASPPTAGQHSDATSPLQKPAHTRGPSDTPLSTNIDAVLAGKQKTTQEVKSKDTAPSAQPGQAATLDEISKAKAGVEPEGAEHDQDLSLKRRPSHARGLSDTTVHSDSTVVSQPTPEELERWARSVDDAPRRPLSP